MILKNASFSYDNNGWIFHGIHGEIESGEILCIMGSNGTGKTTLIKCIAGILPLTMGTIEIEPTKRLSYVPQRKYLNLSYSVPDFICFGRYSLQSFFAKPTKEDYEKTDLVMELLHIEKLRNRTINEISGGELQMCYIAKALVSDPHIIILDEPESNLDMKNQRKIIQLLKTLSQEGKTIILNTHYLNYASSIADRCLLMGDDGHVFGPKEDVLTEENMEHYFGVPIKKTFLNMEGKTFPQYIFL
ncbi:MAG: ABC transporter ATP-binding protein [Tissierellia bacterium]|nr:ABC transporter ATP-binding protein [Tissierellia bacterium]